MQKFFLSLLLLVSCGAFADIQVAMMLTRDSEVLMQETIAIDESKIENMQQEIDEKVKSNGECQKGFICCRLRRYDENSVTFNVTGMEKNNSEMEYFVNEDITARWNEKAILKITSRDGSQYEFSFVATRN